MIRQKIPYEFSWLEKLKLLFVSTDYQVYDDGEYVTKTGMKRMNGIHYITFQYQFKKQYTCPICKVLYADWGRHLCPTPAIVNGIAQRDIEPGEVLTLNMAEVLKWKDKNN